MGLVAGCGTADTEGSGDPCAASRTSAECLKELDAACEEQRAAICKAIFQCEPLIAPAYYGSEAICAQKGAERCKNLVRLPGVAETPDALRECAEKYTDPYCGGTFQQACFPKGTRGLGEPCTVKGQCESRGCFLNETGDCGTCKELKPEGAVCSESVQDCEPDLTCLSITHTCGKALPLDAGCADHADCEGTLLCIGGKCAERFGEGHACTEDFCDSMQLLTCDGQQCVKFSIVAAGQSCAADWCGYGSTCDAASVCVLQPAEGEPCGELGCPSPYRCRGGVCTLEYPECN